MATFERRRVKSRKRKSKSRVWKMRRVRVKPKSGPQKKAA